MFLLRDALLGERQILNTTFTKLLNPSACIWYWHIQSSHILQVLNHGVGTNSGYCYQCIVSGLLNRFQYTLRPLGPKL